MMPLTWQLLLTRLVVNKTIAKIVEQKNDSKEALRIVYDEIIKIVTYALEDFNLFLDHDALLFVVGILFKGMQINDTLVADIIFLNEIEPKTLKESDIQLILALEPPEYVKHMLTSAVLSAHVN